MTSGVAIIFLLPINLQIAQQVNLKILFTMETIRIIILIVSIINNIGGMLYEYR